MTHDDVLKLEELDYNDLRVMISKLPSTDTPLFEELSKSLLRTNFFEMNTTLLTILLDIIEIKNDKTLLKLIVQQLNKTLNVNLSNDIRARIYDMWAQLNDEPSYSDFLEYCKTPSNTVTFNLLIQTLLFQGTHQTALEIIQQFLSPSITPDHYTIELFCHRALLLKDIELVFHLVKNIHSMTESAFYHQFLPLSNQQFGRFLSLSIAENMYLPAKYMFNKFCYYQKLHYLDQGTLRSFAQIAVRHNDAKQVRVIMRYFRNLHEESYNSNVSTEMVVALFESRWNDPVKTYIDKESLAQDFKLIGTIDGLSLRDFPVLVDRLLLVYPLQDVEMIVRDLEETMNGERGNENGATLLASVFIAALSQFGKPELIFSILKSLKKHLKGLPLIDKDIMFYLIRSYYKAENKILSEQSAKFIIGLVLKERDYKLDSKIYRMLFKMFKIQYKGDQSILKPVIDKYNKEREQSCIY